MDYHGAHNMSVSFIRGIETFMLELDEGISDKTEKVASYAYTEIVRQAAVAGGAFRANINISEGSPDNSFDENKTSAIQPNIDYKPYKTYFITSAAPYANRLEHGWSKKQPLGLFALVANAAGHRFK